MNEVLRTMMAHRSVRAYLPEPLPEGDLRAAVEAARCAATSSWIHAYSVLHVTDPAKREQLAGLCGGQAHVAQAGAFLVVCGDARRHRLLAERAGAPFVPGLETFLLAATDAALFAQNLVLAFESMGYGACYVGGLRNRLPEVDALLAIPADVFPFYGLSVGRPDPAQPTDTRPRLPVDALLMKDRYLDDAALLAQVDAFDAEAAAHYAARGLEGRNWSGGVWRKFRQPSRPGVAAYYEGKGARLA